LRPEKQHFSRLRCGDEKRSENEFVGGGKKAWWVWKRPCKEKTTATAMTSDTRETAERLRFSEGSGLGAPVTSTGRGANFKKKYVIAGKILCAYEKRGYSP